jgi:hypothetical protein
MKKNSFVSPLVIVAIYCLPLIGYANERESFQLLEENKMLTAMKREADSAKKEDLVKKLTEGCPFKATTSELADLIPSSVSLTLSANLSEAKKAECNSYLQGFNQSLEKGKGIQGMIQDPAIVLNDDEKSLLESRLKNTMTATSSLRSMLQAQCEFDNSSSDILTVGNQLSNVIEGGSSALYFVNPAAALIGAGTAAAGRLVASLGNWLFGRPQNQLSNEATDSEHFINDLCSFRDLAQKYDKLYSDPFVNDRSKDKELEEKKKAIDRALEESKGRLLCAEQLKSDIDKLQAFSLELTAVADKASSQKQCLNLLNKYIDSKKSKEISPLQTLASRYGCPAPIEGLPANYISYCKNLSAIESMTSGDIYEKCEREDFQKSASAKFTNLSDILFRNIQEDVQTIAPMTDELQKIREAERNEKLAREQFDAIQSMIDTNPITNVNTSKSMTNLGRNLLSFRFDRFAKSSFESAEDELDEAMDALDDLVDQKKDLEGEGFFFWGEKDAAEKAEVQKEICDNVPQIRRQLANAYRSSFGVKDVCDFMKGDGIPPLKARGFNYDNYSAGIGDQSNNLSNRCDGIYKKVTTNFAEIKEQMRIMESLGCDR